MILALKMFFSYDSHSVSWYFKICHKSFMMCVIVEIKIDTNKYNLLTKNNFIFFKNDTALSRSLKCDFNLKIYKYMFS